MKSTLAILALASLALSACQSTPNNGQSRNHELGCAAGMVTGAVVGGIVGSAFGGGRGNTLATGVGAGVGGFAGNQLTC